ncbi:hypothetical protein [Hephaestia mangrovi]|uniref:hypothetical protein n=1 Tax=Hephaestia mangrovi TaxID=2873268 RepID=UPI001CA6CF33|nr:hypothetical protein [Hephaestia mangrovi]MBY8829010.1 hypothetical protein [Hephaestia mangrovi]
MRWLALVVPILLAGCAANGDSPSGAKNPKQLAEIADALKGLTPGKPVSCIDQTRIRDVKKFEGTILYQYSPRLIYRNDVSGGCTGLRYGDPIVSKTYSSQLCRGDIIHTFSPGTPNISSGSCGLGSFVPYTR